ncbi:MAG: hypothetical protein AB7P69_02300 [Candidatus Binatia bacterium]
MNNHTHLMQSIKAMDIQARVCPGGHVYLYVGHTCLFLRQEEFLDVAQIIHAVENHLLEDTAEIALE